MQAMIFVTLKEAIRKKSFVVMAILSFLYLLLWTILLYYFENNSSINQTRVQFKSIASLMLMQTGLQFSSMLISLLTIMLASGTISSELENGIVHAIISRPLKRSYYVVGKFIGLAILTTLFSALLFLSVLIIGALFGLEPILFLSASQILKSVLLYIVSPLCILCITIYGSTIIKTIPNGLLMIFIYILGNIGGMVEMIGGYVNNSAVISSGILISLISPFHTLYSQSQRYLMPSSGALVEISKNMGGLSGNGNPASVWMYVYIVAYAVFFLIIAIRKFGKTDIG